MTLLFENETHRIIGACMQIHKQLGCRFCLLRCNHPGNQSCNLFAPNQFRSSHQLFKSNWVKSWSACEFWGIKSEMEALH